MTFAVNLKALYNYKHDTGAEKQVYSIVVVSVGAGTLRGDTFVTYKNTRTQECYTREISDFGVRMEVVDGSGDVVY